MFSSFVALENIRVFILVEATMAGILIENTINEKLTGEARKNALDFITFMRENEFSCDWSGVDNDILWTPAYKGEGFGNITVAPEWSKENDGFILWIGPVCDFENSGSADNDLKEFAWAHVVTCPQKKYCGEGYCGAGKNHWKIFGKEYESTCHAPLSFFNPDAKAFKHIKKLMLILKQNRTNV